MTPTLAQVLLAGNDAGGTQIVADAGVATDGNVLDTQGGPLTLSAAGDGFVAPTAGTTACTSENFSLAANNSDAPNDVVLNGGSQTTRYEFGPVDGTAPADPTTVVAWWRVRFQGVDFWLPASQ